MRHPDGRRRYTDPTTVSESPNDHREDGPHFKNLHSKIKKKTSPDMIKPEPNYWL